MGEGLNAPQQRAVDHRGGPLLVLAGAGSGKTRVIMARIARFIETGTPPERILGVTFTNKAASQMRDRLRKLVGRQAGRVMLSTFHAFALHLIREETAAAGLRPGFCIYDGADQRSLVRDLLRQVRVADRRLDTGRLLDLLLATKRAGLSEVALRWGDDYELAAFDLYPKFVAQMTAYNAVDFDDLILRAGQALRDSAVQRRWQAAYEVVLVDEYQDTSPEQLGLLRALCPPGGEICAVGDDDQAIYGWRGAAADNIGAFGQHFAGATQIVLEQNYRSTGNILAASNAVMAAGPQRHKKQLFTTLGAGEPVRLVECIDEEDEAQFVCDSAQRLHLQGHPYTDMAILYRSNVQSRPFETTLGAERLAYRMVGGQAFFDRKEVRDAMAYLAMLHNPQDEVALRRIVNVPSRGIGPQSLERLTAHATAQGCSLWEALLQAEKVAGLPSVAQQGARELGAHLARGQAEVGAAPPLRLAQSVEDFLRSLHLEEAVLGADDPPKVAAMRLENLADVSRAVGRFVERAGSKDASLGAFLRASSLVRDRGDEAPAEGLTLMTLHGAKGLEFPIVFFVGLEEGLLPHKRSLEAGLQADGSANDLNEERRLCYVGMTRARRLLFLSHAAGRSLRGQRLPRTRSRYLEALPEGPGIARSSRLVGGAASDPGPGEPVAPACFDRLRQQLGLA